MKTTIAMLAGLFLAAPVVRGGDVNVVLDSTNGASAFRVLDQVSNQLLDVQSGTMVRLGRILTPVLDQRQWDFADTFYIDPPSGKVWQSFTVGRAGRLARILWWNNYFGMTIQTGLIRIREGEGTSGAILWSKVVTWDDYSPPIEIDSNVVVTAGDVLTIEVVCLEDGLRPGYGTDNPYTWGRSSIHSNNDFMFETYVAPLDTNDTLVSIPSGKLGVGMEPTPSSERLTVAGNIVATRSVSAASFAGDGAGLANIGSSALVAGAVTSAKIAAGAVQSSNLATFAVTSNKILWGEVHAEALAEGAVTADKLAPGSVGGSALAANAVDSAKIAPGAVENSNLAADAVTASKLASVSVETRALMNDSVTTSKLTNGAVTVVKLADGACLAELANNDGSGSGLDSDWLDGHDSGAFTRIQAGGLVLAGVTTNILPPHFIPFTLQLASENSYFGGVARVVGFENDNHVALVFDAYNGADGTSTNGGAKGTYGDGDELLQFGSTNYRYQLRCATGQVGLELSTTGSVSGVYYRLIY